MSGLPMACSGQSLEDRLNLLLAPAFPPDAPGVAVLVARADSIIYCQSFGKADLELGVTLKPDHVFRIGSITKQFTACAILKLAEAGKLSLHDTITAFIKDYPTPGVTIEHLLTHTSGINNGAGTWTPETRKNDFTPQELIATFKDLKPDFLPGDDFRYNNNGYVLLGYIIEQVSGMSYEHYISEHFFVPLGMQHSCYDNTAAVIPGRAGGYLTDGDSYNNAGFLSMTQPYSAGSLLSTVEDLYRWNTALMEGRVISKESLAKAHTSYRLHNGKSTGYGYGWWTGSIQGSPSFRHDGLINGFSACAVYLPQEKVFVAVLSNCENNNTDVIASKIAAIAIGKPYHTDKIRLSAGQLASYTGIYRSDAHGQRTISYEDGRLLYFLNGGSKDQLFPFGKDKFYFEHNVATIEFIRDNDGRISQMIATTPEKPLTFSRTTASVNTPQAIDLPPSVLNKYVGKYKFPGDFILFITRDKDRLYGKGAGPRQIRQEIVPYGTGRFFARNLDAQLLFNLDSSGAVIGLTKFQNGEQTAVKIE